MAASCERVDQSKIAFLGSLSPYSNFFQCSFRVNNILYNSAEQYIQSEKAAIFDDDYLHSRIMAEDNPYKIKKLGNKVCNFSSSVWNKERKRVARKAVMSKFSQNSALRATLLGSGKKKLVESSTDPFWGTGLHLRDRNCLNDAHWTNKEGGALSEILHSVRKELRKS